MFHPLATDWSKVVEWGLEKEVSASEIEFVESLFKERAVPPTTFVSPFHHPSLAIETGRRGWHLMAFHSMLARPATAADLDAEEDVSVEIRSEEDLDSWAQRLARAFEDGNDPDPNEVSVHRGFASMEEVQCFTAWTDGKPAASASLYLDPDRIAVLTTVGTLPMFRGRGVQKHLIRHRLRLAAGAGMEVATCTAEPGSISENNVVRLGYQRACTRALLRKSE